MAYNVRRWGGDGWTHDLRRRGQPDGAAFSNWVWWPSSVKAHQLLLLAQERGLGRECKELLLHKTCVGDGRGGAPGLQWWQMAARW